MKIAPSILSCDFSKIQDEIARLDNAKVDYIHFDVMDNHFVPNLTFGHKFISDLRKYTAIPFDVHLMITSPEESIDSFLASGGDIYTFHIEAVSDVSYLYKKIKEKGKKFALSVKPRTRVEELYPYLELVDMILIMTVEPGFGGQSLIEDTLKKVPILRKEIDRRGLNIDIELDGGINLDNIADLAGLGANVFVMGSAFFKNDDYISFMDKVHKKLGVLLQH